MSKPELPSYQTFDSAPVACYACGVRAVPSGASPLVSGGVCCARSGRPGPGPPGSRLPRPIVRPRRSTSSRSILHASLVVQARAASSCCSSPRRRGASSSTSSGSSRRAAKQTATFLDVFRKSSRFSEVQAVCAQLCRRVRSSDCFSPATPSSTRSCAPPATTKPGDAGGASNPEEPGGGGSRAAARVDDRNREARASRGVSRDDGVDHAVHRPVRHRLGHHDVRSSGIAQRRLRRASASSRPASPRR